MKIEELDVKVGPKDFVRIQFSEGMDIEDIFRGFVLIRGMLIERK